MFLLCTGRERETQWGLQYFLNDSESFIWLALVTWSFLLHDQLFQFQSVNFYVELLSYCLNKMILRTSGLVYNSSHPLLFSVVETH